MQITTATRVEEKIVEYQKIEYSPEDVRALIKADIERRGYSADKIELNVSYQVKNGDGESSSIITTYFRNATAEMIKVPKPPRKPKTKEQIFSEAINNWR